MAAHTNDFPLGIVHNTYILMVKLTETASSSSFFCEILNLRKIWAYFKEKIFSTFEDMAEFKKVGHQAAHFWDGPCVAAQVCSAALELCLSQNVPTNQRA